MKAVKRKVCAGLASLRQLQHVLPTNIKKNIYNATVLPHLDYFSVVWLARVLTEAVPEVRENSELWYAYSPL